MLGAAAAAPAALAEEAALILVLTSSDDARTLAVSDAFRAGFPTALRMSYVLEPGVDAGAFVADNIRGQRLSLVFAVGDAALRVAVREFAPAPVVYADVLDRAIAGSRPDVVGLSPRLDPAAVVAKLGQTAPNARKVGIVRASGDADPWWDTFAAAAKGAGLDLHVRMAGGPADAEAAVRELLLATQLLWIQQDARLWTPDVLSRALHQAWIARLPVATYARTHFDSPTPPAFVLAPDAKGMGDAAAKLGQSLLSGASSLPAAWAAPVLLASARGMRNARLLLNAKVATGIDEVVGG